MFTFIYVQPLSFVFRITVIFLIIHAVLNIKFSNSKWIKILNIIGLIVSLWGILYITIFERPGATYELELRPFYSFVMAQKQPESYRTLFMNTVLYIPFGAFLPYVLFPQYKKINTIVTVISALVISVAVEYLQYLYHLGRCETDDVIFNTLGAFIGALSYYILADKIKKMLKKT